MSSLLPLHIERMQAYHLDGVLEIERSSFPTPWRRQAFLSEIHQNDLAYYIVALWNHRVVGYAGMWIILDEAHITTLAVHPAFRGRGIGRRLLAHLLRQARDRGTQEVSLEVRVSNAVAQGLYRQLGFAPVGVRPGYYEDTGEDAIIMRRSLRPGDRALGPDRVTEPRGG
ncbi:MAG: ribosomal protein S18-alanine N-acetyltransferase [Clostridia bacterium]|jgi:ribosomal-protein-alanine N-acetyltransferase|nr:ribosomal protein S18-alanine N-acetyltransferase [Clostridia bacterium]MDH7572071.1 ribosomal protein S18-alanine N-acetyltransferase [Clostridia bacterium]